MIKLAPDETRSAAPEGLRIVVVYENSSRREHAMSFCDDSLRQHPGQPAPEIEWCPMSLLSDAREASHAAARAALADLVVFAVAGNELPHDLLSWTERWLNKREDREGAVVGLIEPQSDPCGAPSLMELFLRNVAHRAGMDYVSHTTPTESRSIPDSLDSYNRRAGHVTAVLDQILRKRPSPVPPL